MTMDLIITLGWIAFGIALGIGLTVVFAWFMSWRDG
jgi:hypothetical protein